MPEKKLHSAVALTPKGLPPCRHGGNLLRTSGLEDVTCGNCRPVLLDAIERGELDADAAALRKAWGMLPPAWLLDLKPLPLPPARRWRTVARMIEAHSVEDWPDDQVMIDLGAVGGGIGWTWGDFTLADLKRLAAAATKR